MSTDAELSLPNVAHVMGFAEYPYIEVARVAEQNGMPELAVEKRHEGNQAAAAAGRDWLSKVEAHIEHATGESLISYISKDQIVSFQEAARQILPHPTTYPDCKVSEGAMARVAAVVVETSDDKPLTQNQIAEQAGLAPATAYRAITELVAQELVHKDETASVGHRPGRPSFLIRKTVELEHITETIPEWQLARELLRIRLKLGFSEQQAMTYLISLGRASLEVVSE